MPVQPPVIGSKTRMKSIAPKSLLALSTLLVTVGAVSAQTPTAAPQGSGFSGIWYSISSGGAYKYSGGMATYPQQHAPIAIYSAQANKTFFVYGGKDPADGSLLHMISYFDHQTKQVARPRVWLDAGTTDAHYNPTLSIDDAGHLWMFSNTHGNTGRAYIRRSAAPFAIDAYVGTLSSQDPADTNVFPNARFSYGQPWHVPSDTPGQAGSFLLLHTRYNGNDRDLYTTTSADGDTWTATSTLAQMAGGQYQISWRNGRTVGTAFDVHPTDMDSRTNLYYLQTNDLAASWRTADGSAVSTPLTTIQNQALVKDYQAEGKRVYLKDLNFDAQGRPIILYLTSSSATPTAAPRTLHTAHWTGSDWAINPVAQSDHNYDHGSLYVEPDGVWRIIGTFLPGPQKGFTGGEIGVWTSTDEGVSWTLADQLTSGSTVNQNYVRRPLDAHEGFYAIWADGDASQPSASSLYFADRLGQVWMLPTSFDAGQDFADPVLVRQLPEPSALGGIMLAALALRRRRRALDSGVLHA
jgi:hypothetical protein